jgi:type I restriction enzyme, R subunit
VQLSGVKLVPSAIEEDHSIREGSGDGIKLPIFDGEHGGSAVPNRCPLDEAIDKVNEMFKAKGIDVSPESVSGFVTSFWGFFDAHEEAVAMAKNNTVAQLNASEGFSGAVGLAVLKTVNESKEIQSYMTDPAFIGQIADIAAGALLAQHRPIRMPAQARKGSKHNRGGAARLRRCYPRGPKEAEVVAGEARSEVRAVAPHRCAYRGQQ